MADTLDEYFEYEAEEFLVSLALLITEGRTPEYSIKGRTEGFHCPPAQSSQPPTTKHECSDKLAQCRQARRTRSEVMLLWKNNIPIMVEVMLLPDCCYSDEGPTTEGNDLNDPAIKQDALLLERWILEPVPRQSGDRFIEEKTLLLAVRSFVFFSQLSAWLSVSHGAVPRNILYRVSAADVDLQWTFSQTPTEHVFPVPNVSHNVALRVTVQSLPRQSNYPVLTCSIHTNLSFYEKQMQERKLHPHGDSSAAQQCNSSSPQRFFRKQTWTMTSEGLLNGKKTPEFTTSIRNLKLYPSTGLRSDFGTSQSKVQCYNATADSKTQSHETPVRTFKSFSLVDSCVSNTRSHQPTGETNPLIGSLLQERQEVIARIAQHLIHCDPATSPVVTGHPFNKHESSSTSPKTFWSTYEDENLLRKGKETSPVPITNSDNAIQTDGGEGKTRAIPEITLLDARVPVNHTSRQSAGESNPLINSLLQERQEVIARIAQHLIHCDPATSHVAGRPFKMHETSPVTSKVFRTTYEDENLLKKGKEPPSVSFAKSDFALLEDTSKSRAKTPDTPINRCDGELKAVLKLHARRKLVLAKPGEPVRNAFHPTSNKTSGFTNIHTSSSLPSCIKENKSELPDKLETSHSDYAQKDQITSRMKQYSNFSSIGEQICTNKDKTVANEHNSTDSFSNSLIDKCKLLEGTKKATLMQVSDSLHKTELKCLEKDTKPPNIYEQNTQLISIENYLNKDHDSFKTKTKQDKTKTAHDENDDPVDLDFQSTSQKKPPEDGTQKCEWLKNPDVQKAPSVKHTNIWRKHNFRSLDGTSTKAFHPRTGLPLLSSPVPQRKTQSGYFDLDSSLLQLKCLSARSPQQCINRDSDPENHGKPFLSSSAPPVTSLSLLGNFEESVLNFRLDPLGIVEGFTAEVGASGVFCPTHMTLPVEVSFYSVSDDNAPSPYMGVITLESLGKRGYRVPPSGTIQVTLFNPNKTVVKMFVVIYDLREMPANHQTFLRQRTFSVPVRREFKRTVNKENSQQTEERLLRYLIHLRFQSSKSGKIYLHRDVRLLFSRKSMEVDSGAAYELKSYTESPTNPQFSPRC
ncbi:F214A protein, partial [Upupa epops]|nr:F214A protein [Upupa epops]